MFKYLSKGQHWVCESQGDEILPKKEYRAIFSKHFLYILVF